MTTLRLGTRQSQLALAQSGHVAADLEARHPGLRVELVPIVTRGDREPGELAKIGGKGLFTAELERGLLGGDLDLAVHSLKDLPVSVPEGLVIAAFPERADPRDVLVADLGSPAPECRDAIADLATGASVLTGSLRRGGQLLSQRADLDIRPIRGNVDTRLRRWREDKASGVVLAAAGLIRLGLLDGLPAHALEPHQMVPAPGQGILALQVRAGGRAEPLVAALDHQPTARVADTERQIVTALGGDCTLPLGAFAEEHDDGMIHVRAVLTAPDGGSRADGDGTGSNPEAAASACLAALEADGGGSLLETLRR